MTHRITTLCLAGCLLATPALAAAQQEGPYANAQVARSLIGASGFDDTWALGATLGYNLGQRGQGFGFEGEITATLSDSENSSPGIPDVNRVRFNYTSYAAYGVYRAPLTPEIGLRARLGVVYIDGELRYRGADSRTRSDNETNLSGGLGLTYAFTRHLHGLVEWTHLDSDINHVGAGVQLRF